MAVLGLRFCARAFSSCGKGGHSSSRCAGLSLSRPLLLRSTSSRRAGSVVVAHGPSCSVACGIFPDQGSNPCPLHWQADCQPLHHQGSPQYTFFLREKLYFKNAHQLKSPIILPCFLNHVKEDVKVSPHPSSPRRGVVTVQAARGTGSLSISRDVYRLTK